MTPFTFSRTQTSLLLLYYLFDKPMSTISVPITQGYPDYIYKPKENDAWKMIDRRSNAFYRWHGKVQIQTESLKEKWVTDFC